MTRIRRFASLFVPVVFAASLLSPMGSATAADPETSPTTSRADLARVAFERVEAAFEGRTKAGNGRELTLLLRDAKLLEDAMSPSQRTELARWTSFSKAARCGENKKFVIHCVNPPRNFSGRDVLAAFAKSHAKYTRAGYKGALRDRAGAGNRPNPNGKTDIYVGDLGAGYYGYCTIDKGVPRGAAAPAFCAVNNDYSWQSRPNIKAMQVTAAHEYFHAVQFAYDVTEDGWMLESTAAWAEDEVYDSINDNYGYLSWSPLRRPHLPMAKFGQTHYGSWIFWKYLGERLTHKQNGMPTVVRGVIRASDGGKQHSLGALKRVLKDRGKTLPGIFQAFSDANRRPVRTYTEGKNYPKKPAHGTARLGGPGAKKQFGTTLQQLSSKTYQFVPRRLGLRNRLRVAVNMPPRFKNGTAVVSVYFKNGKVSTSPVRLNKDGNGTKAVPFHRNRIGRVDVTLVNASSRMKGCWPGSWSSPWSCYGQPVDNRMKAIVNGRVFRS